MKKSFNSSKYWEDRYLNGGNSGTGSYNLLAEFKAEVINEFVAQNNIQTVVEFGCGDGNNLALYEIKHYLGVDVSPKAVELCNARFKGDKTKFFLVTSEFETFDKKLKKAELTMSLDVIYHLIEDDIYEQYMAILFENAKKFVIIYASNKDESLCMHVKHRKFTNWIEKNKQNWKLKKFIKNRYPYDVKRSQETTFADFYIFENQDDL